MRQIKFRAWDGERMLFADMYDLLDGYRACDFRIRSHDVDDYQVMQFTGLYDKNGTEIYEGDIVTCYPDELQNSYQKTVKWAEDRPELGITTDSSGLILCESATRLIEVIGNIYESPELLK